MCASVSRTIGNMSHKPYILFAGINCESRNCPSASVNGTIILSCKDIAMTFGEMNCMYAIMCDPLSFGEMNCVYAIMCDPLSFGEMNCVYAIMCDPLSFGEMNCMLSCVILCLLGK